MSTVERPLPLAAADSWQLIDALLYSISHDLRSPLLSLTLSADLLRDVAGAVPQGSAGDVAIDGLKYGARDMERMLQSLTLLSRARRRLLEHEQGALGLILGGHRVTPDVDGFSRVTVAVDPVTVRELIDDVCGESPVEIRAAVEGEYVALSAPVGVEIPRFEGRPLSALASSLQSYAGSAVERLAVAQVVFERQGASLSIDGGRLLMWLPLGDLR